MLLTPSKRSEDNIVENKSLLKKLRPASQPPTSTSEKKLESLSSLYSNDEQEVIDACSRAISYLSDRTNEKIQVVIEAGVCKRLVKLLMHPSPSVVIYALEIVGYIVTGDDLQTQCIIEHGALPCLLHLLTYNHKRSIHKKACWTISNITSGNRDQIQSVIGARLISSLVSLLQTKEYDIITEAAYALCNATSGGSTEQIKFMVGRGCIKPLCDLLVCDYPRIVKVSLRGLENILKAGETEKTMGNYGESYLNPYAKLIKDANGLENIQNLQRHHDKKVKQKAEKVLATNFFAPK